MLTIQPTVGELKNDKTFTSRRGNAELLFKGVAICQCYTFYIRSNGSTILSLPM